MRVSIIVFISIAPSQAPQHFNGSTISSRFVTFLWSPPPLEHQNGIIISYRINLTSHGATQHYTSTDTNINITGLAPYSSYSLAIAAENSAGVGPYNEFNFTTGEEGTHLCTAKNPQA